MYLFLALSPVISLLLLSDKMSEKQSKSQTKSCKCHHGGQLDTVSLKLTDEFIRHFTHKQTECKQIVFVVVLNLFIMNKWCCPHNRSKAGNRNGSFAVNDINCHHDYTGCFFFFYPWADSQHHLIYFLGVIFHLTFFNIKFNYFIRMSNAQFPQFPVPKMA